MQVHPTLLCKGEDLLILQHLQPVRKVGQPHLNDVRLILLHGYGCQFGRIQVNVPSCKNPSNKTVKKNTIKKQRAFQNKETKKVALLRFTAPVRPWIVSRFFSDVTKVYSPLPLKE